MARKTDAGAAGQAAALPAAKPGHLFEPFAWNPVGAVKPLPAAAVMRFTGSVRDLVAGAALVLSVIETDELATANEETTLFSVTDRFQLLRFAITALRAVEDQAEDLEEWAGKLHTKHEVAR